ncbi:UDP-glucose/GDP-mannose dehydrogenase family protein [Methanocella paludicola SANAE]|uniref:UDP-N-acetyl-D-mannosamine dehydrogenase n=1 Tax=Methanocella paludicola (strain DSM 17711 / JCM 13418 / NBRC 101707 / SANAE) TaxID=304371 RepID=D1YWN0_METPS|nr:nucleotide sugar dehydrogenase [Methanocella paludicola]BAI60852.1 UDP-glucose/GDP-mannose dehydrogenase family protein [Methanocella paludicola SANAE]
MEELLTKINDRTATVGLIGLGYVGLPLAMAFSRKFNVIGYDTNLNIINTLKDGRSNIPDISDDEIKTYVNNSFYPTADYGELKKCDFIIICVPTPLTEGKEPDLSYIKSACETITKILRKGQCIILESTTYPGTTDDVVVPMLEKTGLKAMVDFGVAFSPERIDPGNKLFTVEKIPKIVGGVNEVCTEIAAQLYGSVIDKIIKVKDAKTAEAVKMVENIFRNVNIALVNELSLIFERMGIDAWEVISAASTKPYGYMAFYPGPGIGGHCIPLDPYYLSYQAKRYGFIPRFIETSGEINDFMMIHTINLAGKGLKKINKKIYGSTISIMGLSYKKNIPDTRESPSIKIIEELIRLGANVKIYDPYANSIRINDHNLDSEKDIMSAVKGSDCAIFMVDHDSFKRQRIGDLVKSMRSPVIVDCKNIFVNDNENVVYYGLGKDNK